MAAALVGGAFLSSFLGVLFDRLASKEVIDFFRGRKLDEKLLTKLKRTLMSVNKLLNDAEEKQVIDPHVKNWFDELREAVYEADDLLDDIAYKSIQLDLHADTDKLGKIFTSLNLSKDESKLVERLEEMVEKFKDLMEEKDSLGLVEGASAATARVERALPKSDRQTTSLVNESEVYGREADKDALMRILLHCEDGTAQVAEVDVIPIVGMGGIGKTTLAQLIYNDSRIDTCFTAKAWVCVSDESDIFKVTRNILKDVAPEALDVDNMTPNRLHNELQKKLIGQRFLLVLDDIWDEITERWEKLMQPLNFGIQGSKIIVTTRSRTIASVVGTYRTYDLQVLTDDDCWSLFASRAFKGEHFSAYPDLAAIGLHIVNKCKGSPLAAIALGCLLSKVERDVRKWGEILKSNTWDFSGINVLPALRLSYRYLPPVLKQCFAYCSIFPKDYEFHKEELVLLWLAEGLLGYDKGSLKLKEKAINCFDELFLRSFFQRSPSNPSFFVMHDLMNDLARSISGDFSFRVEGNDPFMMSKRTRHFSYNPTIYNSSEKFKGIPKAQPLHTFLPIHASRTIIRQYISKEGLQQLLPTLERLRVLSLANNVNVNEFPESIANMKHLRYLDFSSTKIQRLPHVVGNLCNVQTLNFECCRYFVELPNSIGRMKYLQFLNLGETGILQLPETLCSLCNLHTLILRRCKELTELPADIWNLVNLCHLDIAGTCIQGMPSQFHKLTNLLNLSDFIVGNQNCSSIIELKELQNLEGDICLRNLENVINVRDAFGADLKSKKHLRSIELAWEGETEDSQRDREVLDGLQPHTGMEHILISGYGGTRFPSWIGDQSFSMVVVLKLINCKNCFHLPPVGQLESLKELYIINCHQIRIVGSEFYGNCVIASKKPFGSLKKLKFEKLFRWQIWHNEGGAFSQLQELYITDCPILSQALPHHLPSLTKLEIENCTKINCTLPRAPSLIQMTLRNHFVDLRYDGHRLHVKSSESFFTSLDVMEQMGIPITCIEGIKIFDCNDISCYPINLFPVLKILKIKECGDLEAIGALGNGTLTNFRPVNSLTHLEILDCPYLKSLPEDMHSLLPALVQLKLEKCPQLELFQGGGLVFPPTLESLEIVHCHKLFANREHWNLGLLPSLSHLKIHKMESLSFPEETLLPSTLVSLEITKIKNLKSLQYQGLQHLSSLQELTISRCHQLENLSDRGLPSTLTSLILHENKNLMSLNGLRDLIHLQTLVIANCPDLPLLTEECLPSCITSLHIEGSHNLKSLNYRVLQDLTCLKSLIICDCKELASVTEDALPSSLICLDISGLEKLEHLDHKGFHHLNSLEELWIHNCPKLHSLPKEGLPSSLSSIRIWGCPLLEERCIWEGEYWPKISHISTMYIKDGVLK